MMLFSCFICSFQILLHYNHASIIFFYKTVNEKMTQNRHFKMLIDNILAFLGERRVIPLGQPVFQQPDAANFRDRQ
jgi:hypothetical protein